MNDILKSKLNQIADDDLLGQALQTVFNEANKEPEVTDNNMVLGEKYRAYLEAKKIIDKAFTTINSYKVGTKTDKKQNRGV